MRGRPELCVHSSMNPGPSTPLADPIAPAAGGEGPRLVYERRRAAQAAAAAAAAQRERRQGAAKLATLLAGLAAAWLSTVSHWFSPWWLLVLVGLFALLAVAHDQTLRAQQRALTLSAWYSRGLARMSTPAACGGPRGEQFQDPAHPYAADLDLFGAGSLFALLCDARTPMGQARLAHWMLTPATAETIAGRRRRIEALRGQFTLRERAAALIEDVKARLEPEPLARWAVGRPVFRSSPAGWLAPLGPAAALVTAIHWMLGGSIAFLLVVLAVEASVAWRTRPRALELLRGLGANRAGLVLFAEMLELSGAADVAGDAGACGSAAAVSAGTAALRRLARLSEWADASGSFVAALADIPLLYNLQIALAVERWRRRHGPSLSAWMDRVAEFEALLSLAAYAAEHPGDPFAEIGAESQPLWAGEQIGHPLLADDVCVRNDVRLGPVEGRIWLVSGSNMAGKSTLLRAVGVNTVLAQMGAPVRARRLRLTPVALGTSLRVGDSLQQAQSGFYAEILRIRQVMGLCAGGRPLLFLFDELLDGTNSHDRAIGARGLFAALLARPAIGMVSTHDLALTRIADELAPAMRNVHLEDHVEAGAMRFDYRLREGVVSHSNALALMRLIGLDV